MASDGDEAEFHDAIYDSEEELAGQLAGLEMENPAPLAAKEEEHKAMDSEDLSPSPDALQDSDEDLVHKEEEGSDGNDDNDATVIKDALDLASQQDFDLRPMEPKAESPSPEADDKGTGLNLMPLVQVLEKVMDDVVHEVVGAEAAMDDAALGVKEPQAPTDVTFPTDEVVIVSERESFEERRAAAYQQPPETEAPPAFGGWFSVFGGIKEKASNQLNKLYDALDPNITPDEPLSSSPVEDDEPAGGDKKSIKSLFDRFSPTEGKSSSGSWLDGLDRTFDLASDRIGQALLGGIKTIENSMGVVIEPASSSSSVVDVPTEEEGSGGEKLSGQVGTLGKNIYAVGLSTLERIGRTTANVVLTTKDRLAPMLDQQHLARDTEATLDRSELKKSLMELFDEFSGNLVLEKLHLSSTEASIALKSRLKALNPSQLKITQASLKGVGSRIEGAGGTTTEVVVGTLDSCQDYFREDERALVQSLMTGIGNCLTTLARAPEEIQELRSKVNSPLPPDNASLVAYMSRLNMAKMLSASLYLILLFDYDEGSEEQLWELIVLTETHLVAALIPDACEALLDAKRREALSTLVRADLENAKSILRDASLAIIPRLKLSRYLHSCQ